MAESEGARGGRLAAAVASAPGPNAQAAAAPEVTLFCLELLGGRYAFQASLVTEVVRLGPLTRLPSAPAFLPGVFTHRGEVLAVLDIAQLVGREPIAITPSTRAAIATSGAWRVAVIAESIEGLVTIPGRNVEGPPANAASGPAEFLSGVARDHRGTIAILELPRLVEVARARSIPA